MLYITYTATDCGNGNTLIEYATGILNFIREGRFWIPTVSYKSSKAFHIIKLRILQQKKLYSKHLDVDSTIHLSYFTGTLQSDN